MIRFRHPRDNKAIIEMTQKELISPLTSNRPQEAQLYHLLNKKLYTGETLVAMHSHHKAPVGFLRLEYDNPWIFIDLLAVAKKYQNQHIGSELINRAEYLAVRNGCKLSRLFVASDNIKAFYFYMRHHYQSNAFCSEIRAVEMIKRLSSPPP